jgi:hypothetical protein
MAESVVDSIHVEPARRESTRGLIVPGRFDTALIRVHDEHLGDPTSINSESSASMCSNPELNVPIDYCIGRLRCVFSLPAAASRCFPSKTPPSHLAYVEWFTPFSKLQPGRHHGLYSVSRLRDSKKNLRASIIPITAIEGSSHLLPKFGPVAPKEWKSSNVLDLAPSFYINSFSIRSMYSITAPL